MTLQCRVVPMGMKSSKVPLREISREHPQEDIMKLALELFEMRRRPEERPFQERFRVLWYNTKLKGYISFDDEPITPESTPKDCIECLIGISNFIYLTKYLYYFLAILFF